MECSAAVASECNLLCTSLSGDRPLRAVCFVEGDPFSGLGSGSVLVEFNTVDPEAMRFLESENCRRGTILLARRSAEVPGKPITDS